MVAIKRSAADFVLGPFLIANISAASFSQKIPISMKCQPVGIYVVQVAETTGNPAVLQPFKAGTPTTFQIDVGPAAAGTVTWKEKLPAVLQQSGYSFFDVGEEISIGTSGASTGASVATVMLRCRRGW